MRSPLLVAALLLAGCPSDGDNPERVWIALEGGSERRLQLVAFEPNPF